MTREDIIDMVRAQSGRTWPGQPVVMHAAVADLAAEALAGPVADALRTLADERDAALAREAEAARIIRALLSEGRGTGLGVAWWFERADKWLDGWWRTRR